MCLVPGILSAFLSSSLLQQAGAGGGLGDQNQLLYSEALNRGGAGGLGLASASTATASGNPYGLNLSDHSSLSLPGGLTGLSRGLNPSGNPAGNAGNLDSLSAAFLRDNALMRERLLSRWRRIPAAGDADSRSRLKPLLRASLPFGEFLGGGSHLWERIHSRKRRAPGSPACDRPHRG